MPIKLLKSLLLFFILSVFISYPLSVNSIELNQVLDNSIEHKNHQSAQIAVKIIDSENNTVILS
ncbi:D-alanyl-D-alanine carboxypeptidase/D-alanyl-D-alanine-endopeptidase, partial [Francisella tularensis subsp. holarctica]|nr:D-alanyl-D-alanine carboxypeptidase/D-alanyl-D-alanine-endopeptidase [Francisella tularensis subsp. holarctica]